VNIDWIEVVWVITALAGLIYATKNLREALTDFGYVKKRGVVNGRRLIARVHLRMAMARATLLSILTIFAAGNVFDLFTRSSQPYIDLTWCMVSILFMFCAITDSHDFAELIKQHDKEHK
jgi:hypothetical protein